MPPATPTTGTIRGKVSFVGSPAVRPGGAASLPASYEVVVLARDGTTVIAKTTTDRSGAYAIAVPPGDYVILTPAGLPLIPKKRNEVSVAAGAVSILDLRVDTGIR